MKDLSSIIVVLTIIMALFLIYNSIVTKKRRRKKAFDVLQYRLGKLRTKWSYHQATIVELYAVASDILLEVLEGISLTNEQRYKILYELEELISLHIAYKIHTMKDSKEFMQCFEIFWNGIIDMPIKKDETYILVKKLTGVRGEAVSLFWNKNVSFVYSILNEKDYIFEMIKNESEFVKKGDHVCNVDLFNLAGKLRQTISIYLDKNSKNAVTSELELTVKKIEEIFQSLKK
jgi:hypothetical protein